MVGRGNFDLELSNLLATLAQPRVCLLSFSSAQDRPAARPWISEATLRPKPLLTPQSTTPPLGPAGRSSAFRRMS